MRWLCLALLCNPVASLADGLSLGQVDLHDLLAVSNGLSHEGNLSDERVLLLLDENRTAADLVTIVTDPKTGYLFLGQDWKATCT